jgi:hypothetical protein
VSGPLLSLLPAVGAALVWLPAAIILLATGAFWKAMGLIAGGTLVIGLVDNLLRPILAGRETKMPDYLILLATLGGLTVFGLAGFVAGPVIAALFLVMWQMFADEYAPLDSSARAADAYGRSRSLPATRPRRRRVGPGGLRTPARCIEPRSTGPTTQQSTDTGDSPWSHTTTSNSRYSRRSAPTNRRLQHSPT